VGGWSCFARGPELEGSAHLPLFKEHGPVFAGSLEINQKKEREAMASCSYCDSFILFGGNTDHTGRYCNASCQQAGNELSFSHQIPRRQIDQRVWELHHGNCPRCGSPGPVDMHKAHKVWSALVLTSWNSSPALACRSCAVKRQVGAALFSGVFGWWGFPWGLIMTPVQVVRNIAEMPGFWPPRT
jgi:hypothetical protein